MMRRLATLAVVMALTSEALAAPAGDGVAVIIGNRNYDNAHEVRFAHRDADAFRRYVADVPGFGEDRILDYRDATLAELLDLFGREGNAERTALWSLLDVDGNSDIVVFYSGHGMPGSDGRGYLLPVDGHPARPELNGYAIETLERNLASLDARSLAVYLDACFSGSSHTGALVTNVSGVYREAPLPDPSGDRMVVLTAASATETAFWDEDAGHGMFTHHLLDALYGAADADANASVTAREAHAYVRRKVAGAVRLAHRDNQSPSLRGAGDRVLAFAPRGGFPGRPELQGEYAPTWPFTVDTVPAGARVRFLDMDERYQPGMELPAGEYRIEATLDGHETVVRTVNHASAPTVHRIALVADDPDQPFTVSTEPDHARVRILNIKGDYHPGMELPPGQYRVEASAEGYETRVEVVHHGAGHPTEHRVALRGTAPQAGDRFRDCPDCPQMAVLPAGRFRMGCLSNDDACYDREKPVRGVRIPNRFALSVHEVTRGEFRRFVTATGHSMEGSCYVYEDGQWQSRDGRGWLSPGFAQTDGHPAVCVSWVDARAYVAWLSRETGQAYRLPSESEWEYAARAGSSAKYHFGNDESDLCRWGNGVDLTAKGTFAGWVVADCADGHVHTAPVGSFKANGWGLHDMHGNVWEWVADCWNEGYEGAPMDGSARLAGDCGERVLRGGSWINGPWELRAAHRIRNASGDFNSGFRVARTLTL